MKNKFIIIFIAFVLIISQLINFIFYSGNLISTIITIMSMLLLIIGVSLTKK